MNVNNRLGGATRIIFIVLIWIILPTEESSAQFTEDFITQSGTGDLTIPMGRYSIGNAIRIEAQISGSWAADGGVYHIVGDWNQVAKVTYRGESSISNRLRFYGYVDPNSSGYMYLFVTWDNKSPNESYTNYVKFRITSANNFDVNNTGTFSNAVELSDVFVVQSTTENVGIGTSAPDKKLTVAGTVKSREVIVEENTGADFVFEEEYELPSLSELEAFIQANKHLPEIPTAGQMKEEGVKVGELQMKLLQKIEELTLYVIELEKRDKAKQRRLEFLENQIKEEPR